MYFGGRANTARVTVSSRASAPGASPEGAHASPPRAFQAVAAGVHGDAREPRSLVRVAAEAVQPAPRLHEGILKRILRRGAVSEQQKAQTKQLASVRVDHPFHGHGAFAVVHRLPPPSID